MNLNNLKIKGFVNVGYPPAFRREIRRSINSWRRFCALKEAEKKALPYSNHSAGIGYELKDGKGNKADRKENFDITSAGKDWLESNIKQIENPTALEFVEDVMALIEAMKLTIFDFADSCEKEFSLKEFGKEIRKSQDNFFVRFIHYFGSRTVGEETASAHADQSGFTLHLFESDPGLQFLSPKKIWENMPVFEGETAIIPDMQMQLRSKGGLKATCHRVVANKKTAEKGRYSAVCFVQFKDTPKYDKELHGRLQEKEPGFNYGMSHEEFSKLFKK